MSTVAPRPAELPAEREPSVGRLVADASRDMSVLVRSEIALAKSELKVSLTAGGVGAALLATAAFFGAVMIVLLSVAIAWFLRWAGLDPWWAYLIVAGFYLLVAGILALVGVRKLKQMRPPAKTITTTKETVKALKPG